MLPVLKTAPANCEGSIDADEQKERTPGIDVKGVFIWDIDCNPALRPALGDKVHKLIRRGEHILIISRLAVRTGYIVSWLMLIPGEIELCEAVMIY